MNSLLIFIQGNILSETDESTMKKVGKLSFDIIVSPILS
jgi:hypothetical protein